MEEFSIALPGLSYAPILSYSVVNSRYSLPACIWRKRLFRVMTEAGLFSDQKVELINGVIVDMSPANPEHEDSIDELTEQMVKVFSNRARVRIEKAMDINDDYWLPHPDLVLAKRRRYGDNPPKPEDIFLIIEVSNTTLAEDLGKKLERYAVLGIQDYWVANLKTKRWIIHRQPFGDRYVSTTELPLGSSFAPFVFPEDGNVWLGIINSQ